MYKHARKPQGFTLVELLVTVSIIAILLGILLPSVAASRRQAKIVACGANLRSIGQLIHVYAQDNDGRLPRGPTGDIAGNMFPGAALFARDVATPALWVGIPYRDLKGEWREPQYTGLGLLLRQAGKRGNEVFFCPSDDNMNKNEESPRIGQQGAFAFSSYLYRQLDMTPVEILREGRLDDLKSNEFKVPASGGNAGAQQFESRSLMIHALALDSNSLGCKESLHTNHDGEKVNVVYKDGSVQSFDNVPQRTLQEMLGDVAMEVPWASLPSAAFQSEGCTPIIHNVKENLDRIFVAADYSFIKPEPWRTPDPHYPFRDDSPP